MKTWMLALALTLISNMALASSFVPQEAGYFDPDLVQTRHLRVVPEKVEGFSEDFRPTLDSSFDVLEQVVNSETFKQRVLNFKNARGDRSFASNNGKSNEEIYEIFMEGREKLLQNTPGEMNLYLKRYSKWWSKVIGWTNGNINTIHLNWKFYKNYRPHQIASNLAHEWTHKIGFDHASAAEHDSAPYAIGYIVEELSEQVLAGQELY